MTTGENDIPYTASFLNVRRALLFYHEDRETGKKYFNSFDTTITYLKNKISVDRFTKDNLKYDLENIVGGVDKAFGDAVDFNEIMPEKYKSLQAIDKQIQILESIKKGEAKKEDVNEALDFFRILSEGYHHFADQNRYNPFSGFVHAG